MMIERDFYRLPELAARWGFTTDDLLQLAVSGHLQLAVAFCVPKRVHNLHVTIAELSGEYRVERLPYAVIDGNHSHLFCLTREDAWTFARTGEVDLLRAYNLDGDLVLFEWPPGTGFRVTQESVVVRSRDAEVAREAIQEAEPRRNRVIAIIREQDAAESTAEGQAAMALLDEYAEAKRAWERWLQVPAPDRASEALLWEKQEHDRRHRLDELRRRIDDYENGISGPLLDRKGTNAPSEVALHAPPLQPTEKVQQKKAPERHGERILAAILRRGLDPLSLAPPPLGKSPWPLREDLLRELKLTDSQAKKAFTWLREVKAIKHSTPHPNPTPQPRSQLERGTD